MGALLGPEVARRLPWLLLLVEVAGMALLLRLTARFVLGQTGLPRQHLAGPRCSEMPGAHLRLLLQSLAEALLSTELCRLEKQLSTLLKAVSAAASWSAGHGLERVPQLRCSILGLPPLQRLLARFLRSSSVWQLYFSAAVVGNETSKATSQELRWPVQAVARAFSSEFPSTGRTR